MTTTNCALVSPAGTGIARIQASDLTQKAFISQYFLRNQPVIIENAVPHWPAARWDLETIKDAIPDQKVAIRNNSNGQLFDAQTMSQSKTEMMLHAYVDLIREGRNTTPLYLAQVSLRQLLRETRTVPPRFPYLRRGDYLMRTNLWIGTPGLATPAHFDFTHNFYIQISGHKQITLFAPDDSPYLYPNPRYPVVSQVDVGHPDLHTYPEFPNASPVTFMIGPGDAVFIPARWWHYIVSCYDNNIAINQWFLRPWSRNLTQARMIPPLLGHSFRTWWGKNP
jgi:ribosomal protein L16 Arg81 hydroxylase